MLRKIIFIVIILCLAALFTFNLDVIKKSSVYAESYFHTSESAAFSEEDSYAGMNYGLYWAKYNNTYIKTDAEGADEAYDPLKPTMIFIHGFQSNSGYFKRETLGIYDSEWIDEGGSPYLADYWLDAGYNVGMFQWNQFCDEISQLDAESKIWSLNGPVGMRWKKRDGVPTQKDDPTNPNKPMAELFVDIYLSALKDFKGEEIRIVGHSMGAMFATAASGLLYEMNLKGKLNSKLMPSRLTLLDPYFGTTGNKKYDINWKDQQDTFKNISSNQLPLVLKDYVKKLHNIGVAIDYYKSSFIGQTGLTYKENIEHDFDIRPYIALVNMDVKQLTEYTDIFNAQGAYHSAGRDFYFYSVGFDKMVIGESGENYYLPTASVPNSVIYSMSGKEYEMTNIDYQLSPEKADYSLTDYEEITGAVSGFLFHDINGNGLRDDGPINAHAGVTVRLYNAEDELIAETTTDKAGYYSFSSPGQGSYYIIFDNVKRGYFVTAEEGQYFDVAGHTDAEGRTKIFTLNSEKSNMVINAALNKESLLSVKYMVIYFIGGILLVGGLTFIVIIYSMKKTKKEVE